MSSDDSTAEKAWEEYRNSAEYEPYSPTDREVFMAGRASRDAEVAELKANAIEWRRKFTDCHPVHLGGVLEAAKLREQIEAQNIARGEPLPDEVAARWTTCTRAEAILQAEETHAAYMGLAKVVESLREQLAEAQATIAKVRAYAEDRAFHAKGHLNTVNSGRIASDLLAILSAPSSTGGDDHE